MRPVAPLFAVFLLSITLAGCKEEVGSEALEDRKWLLDQAWIAFGKTIVGSPPVTSEQVNVDQDATCRPLIESICRKDGFCRWDYRADICVRR
jgi:hypothetical protein